MTDAQETFDFVIIGAGPAGEAALEGIGETWGFSAPSRWVYQVSMAWDAVNARWNEWILGYGPDTQNAFMKWLGMHEPTYPTKQATC